MKEHAVGLLHRKRYMASRVSEARQLQQPPAAVRRRELAQHLQQEQQQPGPADGEQLPQQVQPPEGAGHQQQQEQQDNQPARSQGAAPELGTSAAAAAAAAAMGPEAGGGGPNGAAAADQTGGLGPSGAAQEEQAGMECPVCLGMVPAGADIHVFSGCGHAFCKGGWVCMHVYDVVEVGSAAGREFTVTPSLGHAPHPSHRTCHAPCRLRRQAGAAARFLRRVPPKGDCQASGARGGGRQHLQRCSLRPRVRCAGQGEGGGPGVVGRWGAALTEVEWMGWRRSFCVCSFSVHGVTLLVFPLLCRPCCPADPAAGRVERQGGGAAAPPAAPADHHA